MLVSGDESSVGVSLGLSLFAINVAMLALAEWIAPDFSIDGFWTYIGATIVVWLVNYILHGLFRLRWERETVERETVVPS